MSDSKGLGTKAANMDQQMESVLRKVAKALQEVQYGEVVIKVQGGKVIWVDKYERERVG